LAHDGSLCNSRTTSSSTHLLSYSSGAARALLSFPTRRSSDLAPDAVARRTVAPQRPIAGPPRMQARVRQAAPAPCLATCACLLRSEEHTSELQSRENLVCRLLLEKKNTETEVTK